MKRITIDGFQCSEADVAAITEALSLFVSVGQGQISDIGSQLYNSFLGRKDVTADFRLRVIRARDFLNQAHLLLHGSTDPKARFDPAKDAVPISAVRAYQLLSRLNDDEQGVIRSEQFLHAQAEMNCPAG